MILAQALINAVPFFNAEACVSQRRALALALKIDAEETTPKLDGADRARIEKYIGALDVLLDEQGALIDEQTAEARKKIADARNPELPPKPKPASNVQG